MYVKLWVKTSSVVPSSGETVSRQSPERPEILNMGGWSDVVFSVISAFLEGDSGARFVREVEAMEL